MRVFLGFVVLLMTADVSTAQQNNGADLEAWRAKYIAEAVTKELYECSAWNERNMNALLDKLKIQDHNDNEMTQSFQRRMLAHLATAASIAATLRVPSNSDRSSALHEQAQKRLQVRLEQAQLGDAVLIGELMDRCAGIEATGAESRIKHFTDRAALVVK